MIALYNTDDLASISLFGPEVRVLQVEVEAEPGQLGKLGQGRGRSAEVIFVVSRAGKDVLLINKAQYPAGTYRIPTGGVEAGESPQEAARREIYEETGYQVEAPGLLSVVNYTLNWPGLAPVPFVSYVFLALVPSDQPPQATDPMERIADFRWIPITVLGDVAAQLNSLPSAWAYWGRFRAVAYGFISDAVLEYIL